MTIKLKYGNTNTFLINNLLFDTDMPNTLNSFFKAIKQEGVCLNDIKYVLCSHYHPDHMGLVNDLMNLGVKLLVHQNQKDYIHSSDEILRKQFGSKFQPIDENKAVFLSLDESRNFLNSIGIQGEIILTKSHSNDGIALILDNGECFAGDIEPFQFINGYKENKALEADWSEIKNHNAKIIHYGHNIDQSL